MQREVEIERRSRSLSAAADDAAARGAGGYSCDAVALRAVRFRAAPQVKIVRALHDVCVRSCGEATRRSGFATLP